MLKYYPLNYFGVELYTTWPPRTGPVMSAFLLGGCAKHLPLALSDLPSNLHPVSQEAGWPWPLFQASLPSGFPVGFSYWSASVRD